MHARSFHLAIECLVQQILVIEILSQILPRSLSELDFGNLKVSSLDLSETLRELFGNLTETFRKLDGNFRDTLLWQLYGNFTATFEGTLRKLYRNLM